MISWNVRIGAKRSAEGNVSCLPFDTCRAEIYRRQRNSCWSRCTRATSPADHPARKLPSPDKPEHRPRSQCTQWDRCTVEALHRTSGGHHHRCGLSPDGYNPPGTHLHTRYPWFRCRVRRCRRPSCTSMHVPYANRVAVRTGVEDNRLIGGQGLIYVHKQVVKRAERWHGAHLAIGEETAEFLLGC